MGRLAAQFLITLSLGACTPGEGVTSDTVTLQIRYSAFEPGELTVALGTTVRFVVENQDPIAHELIVGDQAVQDLHERGTGHHHGEVPGEISAPAGSTVETTYTFEEAGTTLFGCHLPGHYAYGMRGTIRVV
jgi:uncharacterized cupredoxin-like copper-binding protein